MFNFYLYLTLWFVQNKGHDGEWRPREAPVVPELNLAVSVRMSLCKCKNDSM